MSGDGSGHGRRVAVVVVHGVGNNQPGSTVNAIVDGVCDQKPDPTEAVFTPRRRIEATPENEVFMFAEPQTTWQGVVDTISHKDHGKPVQRDEEPHVQDVARFPVYGRHANLPANGTAEFFELHWADLARGGNSWIDTVRSFARFVFEIPHVIDGFLRDPPGPVSAFLRRVLLLATCFVRGPLAGYTAVMLAGGLAFLSFSWIPEREDVVAVVSILKERAGNAVATLPGPLPGAFAAAFERLPETHSRSWMISWIVGLLTFAAVAGFLLRHSTRALFVTAFVGFVSAFYLADMLLMRPLRYKAYGGFVYLDYLSVVLFGAFMCGVYMFVTRRIKAAGFADLGLSISFWSALLILHMSVVGDYVRTQVLGKAPMLVTDVTTSSSKVHFEAFAMYYPYLTWLWTFWAVLMLIAFVLAIGLYAVNWKSWNERHRGLFAAIGLAIAQSCVWLTAIPALGVMHMDDVLCRGHRNYATVRQPVSCQPKLDINNQAVDLLLQLKVQPDSAMTGLPTSLRAEIAKAVDQRSPFTLDLEMLNAMRDLALAFIWNGFILVAAAGIAILVALYRHFKAKWFGARNQTVRMPRLIINNAVLGFLLAFGLADIVLAIARLDMASPINDAFAAWGLSPSKRDVPAEVVKIAILTTTLLMLATQIPAITTPLSGVFQIMQGLIDHHYRVSVSLIPRFFVKNANEPIRRDHITRRFDEIVRRLIVGKGYDDIVFLAHSQGTIVVYEYLNSPYAQVLPRPVHVVTAGSPLGEIYAYYFNEYDQLQEQLAVIATRTASWTNLYRLDDPIAGPIVPLLRPRTKGNDDSPADAKPGILVRDEQLPPGGHLRYWQDPVVREAIRGLLMGQPASVAARPRTGGAAG